MEGGDNPPPPEGDLKPTEKTFTQAEVTAMMAREKDQGRRSAEESIAKQLGCTPEEAKAILDDARKKDDAQKTEAQRATEAANAEKAAATKEKEEARREKLNTRIEAALIRAGVAQAEDDKDGKKFEAKMARLMRLVDVDLDADVAAVAAAVKTLKDEEPGLFGATQKKGAPNSDPTGKPPAKQPDTDAFTRGRDRAKASAGAGTGYSFMNPKT